MRKSSKVISMLLCLIIAFSSFAIIPFSASAEEAANNDEITPEVEGLADAEDEPDEDELNDAVYIDLTNEDQVDDLQKTTDSNSFPTDHKADEAEIADTGYSYDTNKLNMLSSNLFYNAKYYNNDLAKACANLCVDVDDISSYFPSGQSKQYTSNIASNTFHVGIGYKTIFTSGSSKNLITVSFRGTGSALEAYTDFIKDYEHQPYLGEEALFGPYYFAEIAREYLDDFISNHPSVNNYPITYLVTGYSLGGAAANLLGAKLTNESGGDDSDNVFVYTFGAIKAIASSANQDNGYKNIYNIYNYYDSWGPNGSFSISGVSDPEYKFGITYLCNFNYDQGPLGNHDMGNYRTAVETDSVNVVEDRKAGILGADKWWKLSGHFFDIYGAGDIGDENNVSWNKYKDEIKYVDIHDGITSIGKAFNGCSYAETLWIPKGVTRIVDYAFSDCSRIERIYYNGTHAQWDAIALNYDKNVPLKTAKLYCLGDVQPPDEQSPTDGTDWTEKIVDSGSCGDNLQYTLFQNGLLVITGTGDMYDYSGSPPWKNHRDSIVSIVIDNNVASIGDYAFYYCEKVKSVLIGKSVTDIGDNAFTHCEIIKRIIIPNNVAVIGEEAFTYCYNLNDISIGEGLSEIGRQAFSFCNKLSAVHISSLEAWCKISFLCGSIVTVNSNVTNTLDYTSNPLAYAHKLYLNDSLVKELTIPNSINKINAAAFYYCTSLEKVIIPDEVTSIGQYAFWNCNNIKSIRFSNNIERINYETFRGCWNLKNIIIPNSVDRICTGAFYDCYRLESVDIPEGVTQIQKSAFQKCTGLKSLSISDSVSYIDISSFYSCKNSLESIKVSNNNPVYDSRNNCNAIIESSSNKLMVGCKNTVIPNSVTEIGDNAFYNCKGLTSITIPNSVTRIGYYAFDSCTNLTTIIIPDSVVSIETDAFRNTAWYTALYNSQPDGLIYIGKIAYIVKGEYPAEIEIKSGTKSINNRAFYNCSNLTSVTIPDSVTIIGNYAFSGCKNLTKMTIPNSVRSIGTGVFEYCRSLTSVTIPNSVTNIGSSAFYSCSSLISITIPNSVTSIGSSAFYSCSSLTSVIIPNSVTSIGQSAFSGCSSLTSVIIPNSVTSIGQSAFSGCSSLTSVTIPNSVTSIDYYTFRYCRSLTSVTIPDSVTSISMDAFRYCSSLTSVIIPDSVTSIGSYVFSGCKLKDVYYIGSQSDWNRIKLYSELNGATIHYIKDSHISSNTETSVQIKNAGQYQYNIYVSDSDTTIQWYSTGSYDTYGYIYDSHMNELIRDDNGGDNNNFSITYQVKANQEYILACRMNDSETTGSFTVKLDNQSHSDYSYIVLGDGTAEITRYTGTEANIIIPTKIDGYTVSSIGASAFTPVENETFNPVTTIETVVIPDTVKSIGMLAFANCTKLTELSMSDSVKAIEAGAFQGCTKLNKFTLSNGITSIQPWTFMNCSSLSSIEIPNTVTSIGWRAFENCSALESVTIPDSVTSLEEGGTFSGCINLKNAVISDNLTTIPASTFMGCLSLNEVTVGDSVTAIESDAFFGCTNLDSITLPQKIESIAEGSLGYYRNASYAIKKVDDYTIYGYAGTAAERYANDNGFIFVDLSEDNTDESDYEYRVLDDGTAEITKYNGDGENITIPSSLGGYTVTSIGNFAFYNNTDIISVTIPDSVKSIGYESFYMCENLVDLTLGDSVEIIGVEAFSNCVSLPSVTIPDSVTTIDCYSFESCTNLKIITIPDSVTTINDLAFWKCSNLTNVTIGKSVTSIGEMAFGYYRDEDRNTVKVDGFTIYGYDNTEAKRYANANGFSFVPRPEDYLGDADGNGEIESVDVTWIQRHAAGMDIPFTINILTADIDGDGNITVMDATAIQYYLANMNNKFNIGTMIS